MSEEKRVLDRADIELLFQNGQGNKSIFDELIWRILHKSNKNSYQALIDYYNNGIYCYKFADVLKDAGVMDWLHFADWNTVRKVWIKMLELTPYLGTYRGYDEMLRYIFGEDVEITYNSRTTEVAYNEQLDPVDYYEWEKVQDPTGNMPDKLYTDTKKKTANVIANTWDPVMILMTLVDTPFEIITKYDWVEQVQLIAITPINLIKDADNKIMQTEHTTTTFDKKNVRAKDQAVITYRLTGNSVSYKATEKVLTHAGVLDINLEGSFNQMVNNLLWYNNAQKNIIIQYTSSNTTLNPLYLTEFVNWNTNTVQTILDYLTPVGLLTRFNLTINQGENNG